MSTHVHSRRVAATNGRTVACAYQVAWVVRGLTVGGCNAEAAFVDAAARAVASELRPLVDCAVQALGGRSHLHGMYHNVPRPSYTAQAVEDAATARELVRGGQRLAAALGFRRPHLLVLPGAGASVVAVPDAGVHVVVRRDVDAWAATTMALTAYVAETAAVRTGVQSVVPALLVRTLVGPPNTACFRDADVMVSAGCHALLYAIAACDGWDTRATRFPLSRWEEIRAGSRRADGLGESASGGSARGSSNQRGGWGSSTSASPIEAAPSSHSHSHSPSTSVDSWSASAASSRSATSCSSVDSVDQLIRRRSVAASCVVRSFVAGKRKRSTPDAEEGGVAAEEPDVLVALPDDAPGALRIPGVPDPTSTVQEMYATRLLVPLVAAVARVRFVAPAVEASACGGSAAAHTNDAAACTATNIARWAFEEVVGVSSGTGGPPPQSGGRDEVAGLRTMAVSLALAAADHVMRRHAAEALVSLLNMRRATLGGGGGGGGSFSVGGEVPGEDPRIAGEEIELLFALENALRTPRCRTTFASSSEWVHLPGRVVLLVYIALLGDGVGAILDDSREVVMILSNLFVADTPAQAARKTAKAVADEVAAAAAAAAAGGGGEQDGGRMRAEEDARGDEGEEEEERKGGGEPRAFVGARGCVPAFPAKRPRPKPKQGGNLARRTGSERKAHARPQAVAPPDHRAVLARWAGKGAPLREAPPPPRPAPEELVCSKPAHPPRDVPLESTQRMEAAAEALKASGRLAWGTPGAAAARACCRAASSGTAAGRAAERRIGEAGVVGLMLGFEQLAAVPRVASGQRRSGGVFVPSLPRHQWEAVERVAEATLRSIEDSRRPPSFPRPAPPPSVSFPSGLPSSSSSGESGAVPAPSHFPTSGSSHPLSVPLPPALVANPRAPKRGPDLGTESAALVWAHSFVHAALAAGEDT